MLSNDPEGYPPGQHQESPRLSSLCLIPSPPTSPAVVQNLPRPPHHHHWPLFAFVCVCVCMCVKASVCACVSIHINVCLCVRACVCLQVYVKRAHTNTHLSLHGDPVAAGAAGTGEWGCEGPAFCCEAGCLSPRSPPRAAAVAAPAGAGHYTWSQETGGGVRSCCGQLEVCLLA
jgi:hypothetical protein